MTATTTERSSVTAAVPAGTWAVDPVHSSVEFRVKHMGIATVKGEFTEFGGALEIGADGSGRAYGTVEASSVSTRNKQRDAHLLSNDFFGAEENPQLRFESTSIEAIDDETLRIVGDLTIKGITRQVELRGEIQGRYSDASGEERVGLEVTGALDRFDYGLTWNQALESGGVLVGRQVKLVLNLSAVRAA